jgi:hypothetical protein
MSAHFRANWRTAPAAQRLLRLLRAGGAHFSRDLSLRAHCTYGTAIRYLREMNEAGEIHVAEWGYSRGHLARRWVAGPGENAAEPPRVEKPKNAPGRQRGSGASMQRVVAFLRDRGFIGTAVELATAALVSISHTKLTIAQLHAEKQIYIVRWLRGSQGPATAVYAWRTDGQYDRARPVRRTVTEHRHHMRARIRNLVGDEAADAVWRAMYRGNGPSTVVVEGRVVYQRGAGVDYRAMQEIAEAREAA